MENLLDKEELACDSITYLKKQVKYVYFVHESTGRSAHYRFEMKRLPNRVYSAYYTNRIHFLSDLLDNLQGTHIGINFRATTRKYDALDYTDKKELSRF